MCSPSQGYYGSNNEPSPTQKILTAVTQEMYALDPEDIPEEAARISYVLRLGFRALADAVVPPINVLPQQDLESRREAMEWGMKQQTQITRQQLLSIAETISKLENNQ